MQPTDRKLTNLISTIKTLRDPSGCPWDKKQTSKTLIKYLTDETEELVEGIEKDDHINICEELGDVLYLILMVTEIHADQDHFDFDDVIKTVNNKLIRRHPHVFSDSKVTDEQGLKDQWESIKRSEKQNI